MRFLDEWDKKDARKKQASMPAAQKMPLQPPLLLTRSGVVMADGKGGGRIITPQAGQNTASAAPVVSAVPPAPIVPALPTKSAAQTAGSAGRTATPQKSEAQRRVDNLPNIHAFGAGDYTGAAGLMEKAWQTGKAGVLAVRGAFKEIEGQATPVNREQHLGTFSGFGDLGRAVSESRRTGESIDAITDRLETERLQRREKQRQATYDRASELFEKSAQAQEQAKEGLGTVGRFMVDMGVTGIQMAGDALVNLALPGGGLYMMGLRSYGQAANEARREGKSEEQQFVAGLKSAGIETLTEKMFGAFGELYGAAGADELVEKLVTKLTGNRTGQALLTWIINGVGEGVEEVTSDLLHPLADRLLKLDDGRGPMFTTDDAAQMGYDFLLGAAMGLVGGTGQLNRGVKQGRAQTAENAYYENLQKNGLFGGNSGQLAQRAIDAMGRAMPGEYAKKRMDTSSPTGGRHAPNIFFRDNVSTSDTSVPQGTQGVNAQDMRNGVKYAELPRLKNENGLLSLTEQEKENLSSGAKNKVVSTFQDAVQFVRNALANKASVERAYMGKVPESTARRVMQETGINIDGMGVMMNGVDVRHIIKSHGDPTLETARGQVMVTAEAIAHIPEIIAQPDAVYLSETNDAKGRKAIVFEKRFGDTYITVQGVSNGKNLLQTDTLYIQKGKTRTSRYSMLDVQENAAPEINAQSAPPQGPSYIDTSIPQGTQGVNAQDMRNGVKYAELPRLVDANGMDAQQRTAWLGALEQMPQAQRNQFETAAQIAKRFGAAVQAQTMQEGVQGSYQNGVIYIDPAAVDPVRQVLIHELTHHMETSGLYGKFSDAALRFMAEDMGADVDALRRAVIEDYAKAGVALDENGATRELVAKFAEEKLFTDEATVRRLLAQDRNLFQRIYDWLRDTAAKLTGTPEQRRLIDAQNLYEKALRQAEAGTQDSGTQYDIRKLEDGRRYVQADRQVIFGNDPESWSVQLEDYINGKIRRGQDVQLIAEDGDILTLTKDSAGKLADNHTGDGRTMSESAFERKVNAAAHIDELAQISMRGKKNTPDYNARHGAMAADGWNYRTAYFRDFDGRYYMVTISTALNPEGAIIYNVGHMKEEAFPKIKGSYAENGNGPRGNASTDSIPIFGGNVNTEKFSTGRSIEEMAGVDTGRPVQETPHNIDVAPFGALGDYEDMPATLRKIGVAPFGAAADYANVENLTKQISGNEQARRQMKKEVSKVPASEKERLFARQLADGTINWEDVPRTVNRSTVELLEDYYRTMDTGTETQLLRDRRDLIFEREEAKMPSLLGMDVRYDEGGLRESGKPSGRVARQVSTLRRNLQTPARVCATEWGQEHGKRVYEALFQPVTENNGRQIDWVNSMLDRVRTFKGADGKARELNRAERDLVQRLVETHAAEARVVKAGDRQQKLAAAEKSAKGEWERAKAAVKGTTVEEYLRQNGYIKDEEETALRHAAFEYWEKRKAGGLENISRDEYIRMAYPALAEYESAKYTGKKEMYKRVVAGDLKSQSAMRVIQEAINGGSRAKAYLDWLGIDWRGYEKTYFSQDAIFKRNTEADNERSKLERTKKTAATAAKQAKAASIETKPFLSAAENIRNGWAAADAAKEFGIDKSQQEYRDLENYAAYLEAKKRAESDMGVDPVVVDEAVKTYSTLYQELYDGINTFLAAHGYKPIGFIEGYAPHMQPEEAKTAFSKALKMLGLDDTAMMLPTSVSGMTADLKPYKQYDPFFQTRHGDKTEYDIVKGFENYVYYLGNIFYHTDDIMRIRTAAKYIRKTYTSEEASEQISWAENARNFDDAGIEDFLRFNGIIKKGTKLGAGEARAMLNDYIDGLYEQIGDVSRYSEMVKYLDNYANRLAGKQNMLDRGAEAAAGRRSLNWVNSLLGKYGGAKLAFNVSTALNQTSQLPMVMVENGEITTAKAIRDFFTKSRSDFVQHSNFLKGKKGVDWILGPETGWEKFKEAGFSMTEAVDSFTSYVAVRSKYLKEKRLGASDTEAMKAADEYGRNIMGSRARGEKPMLFDTKNPFWQIATRFQLEAMNSWEHITRDIPAEIRQTAKEKGKLAATGQLAGRAVRYTLAAFLINCGIGALSGGSPVPYDVLGATAEAVGAAMGLTGSEAVKTLLDNVLQAVFDQRLFGTDEPEDDEDKDWWAALESFFSNAANDVPILGRAAALAGIGDQTLPTADFSKLGDLVNSARNNGILSTDTLDKAMTAGGEFLYGGNQLRKTVQGTMAAAQGGVYSKGKLRYQVDRSPWNVGRAVLFGRGALDETEEYYARQAKQFSEKQTTAWEKLQETGEPDKTAQEQRQLAKKGYDLIQELRSIEKEDDDNRAAMQRQILRKADISDEAKAVVWYEMMASEKDQKTMDALKGADMGEVARVLMDMKDRRKDSQKLDIIMSSSLTDDQKGTLYLQTLAGDEDKEKVAVLKDAGMDAYQYLAYKTAISGLSGRTEKLYAIHTMDLSDYQKDALYYLNGWSKKTHDDVPWVQGVSAEAAANRLAMAVIDRESQPEEEPEWKQSLASLLGTGTGSSGNPFLRAMQASGYTSADMSENPFVRAVQKREAAQTAQATQSNPFVRAMQRRGTTQTAQTENPFVRAMQKREAAQTNPFLRGQG